MWFATDFEVDDIRTMMCGLGSMMAADARGAMSFDWRRQLRPVPRRGAYQAVVTLRAAMRRLIATSLVLSALLIAGCGGGDDSGSALDSALSYLPKDAPFAVAIDTDLDGDQYKALQALLKKFPFGGQVQDSLRQQLEQGTDVDFDDDVRPVLGNPLVVGGTDATLITGASGEPGVVAAIRAKDKGALDDLIDKTKPKKTGEESGATLYEDGRHRLRREGRHGHLRGRRQQLTQALKRADGRRPSRRGHLQRGARRPARAALSRGSTPTSRRC